MKNRAYASGGGAHGIPSAGQRDAVGVGGRGVMVVELFRRAAIQLGRRSFLPQGEKLRTTLWGKLATGSPRISPL